MVNPAANKHCRLCPSDSSKWQAMVACIELPAGFSWPDTSCQREPGEAHSNRGTTQMSRMHHHDRDRTRMGRGGEQWPGVTAWEPPQWSGPRCVRAQVPQARGAQSGRGRLRGSATSPARRSPRRRRAWGTAPAGAWRGRSQGKGAKGEKGKERWGRGRDPSHLNFSFPSSSGGNL